ncbi:MAG: alpha/beta fold hydrolase [Nitrospirota bacterium]
MPIEQAFTEQFCPGENTVFILATPPAPTQKIVLLIHGFLSNKNSDTNLDLSKFFIEKGIATVRLDLYAHGESDGLFLQLSLSRCLLQVSGLIAWIKKNGYEKIALVGSSFGGLIAIHTAAKHADIVSLSLKCPVSNYPPLWQKWFKEDGLANWKERNKLVFFSDNRRVTLEYGFYSDLLQYPSYQDAAHLCIPTLIVHGDADEDVPVDQSLRLFETLRLDASRKRLEVISGADHGFEKPDDFNQMVHHIEEWVMRFF